MSDRKEELKHRLQAKRKELEAKLEHAKADAAGAASETVDSIKRRIEHLDDAARRAWENLSDDAVRRINELLKD